MTHVLLIHDEDEMTIAFPTEPTFQAFLKTVRRIQPDRRFQIYESWEA